MAGRGRPLHRGPPTMGRPRAPALPDRHLYQIALSRRKRRAQPYFQQSYFLDGVDWRLRHSLVQLPQHLVPRLSARQNPPRCRLQFTGRVVRHLYQRQRREFSRQFFHHLFHRHRRGVFSAEGCFPVPRHRSVPLGVCRRGTGHLRHRHHRMAGRLAVRPDPRKHDDHGRVFRHARRVDLHRPPLLCDRV